jgi:hypothetical protein
MPTSVSFDSITTSGNVGIGTSSPTSKLTINSGSTSNQNHETSYHGLAITTGSNEQTLWLGYDGSADVGYINCAKTGSQRHLCLQTRGYGVGIGTTTPQAALHVQSIGTGTTTYAYGSRRYFRYDIGLTNAPGIGEAGNAMSIYSRWRIVANDYIVSHGSYIFSDRRIKDNIVDVEDDQCLQKIRLLKPKNYTYKDTVAKGSAPVWGFIAQEVSEVLDYAVEKSQQIIPSIYKLASVSEDGHVLTFDDPVSLELTDSIKLQIRTLVHEELDVIVSEIISSTSVRLEEPLTEKHHTGIVDDQNIVRKVFVYGQYVDDFHVLKKDAIFTVSVAALQEVDRRQVADKKRILELEGEVNLLKQQLASITERLTQAGI